MVFSPHGIIPQTAQRAVPASLVLNQTHMFSLWDRILLLAEHCRAQVPEGGAAEQGCRLETQARLLFGGLKVELLLQETSVLSLKASN